MQSRDLNARIRAALATLTECADELRDLDQALGDGDLGITITAGSKAVIADLESLSDDATPVEIVRAAARAFANANPSTMAALVAGALLAGSRQWEGKSEITIEDGAAFVTAAAGSIAQRGKTDLGDKTILDGIDAAAKALSSADSSGDPMTAVVAAAARAVDDTTPLQSRRGRASWLQERSIGHPDPGATAFLRLVEAWAKVPNTATH